MAEEALGDTLICDSIDRDGGDPTFYRDSRAICLLLDVFKQKPSDWRAFAWVGLRLL